MGLFKKREKPKITPKGMTLTEAMLNLDKFDIDTQNDIMKQYEESIAKFTRGIQEIVGINEKEQAAFHAQVREAWGFGPDY